MSPRRLLPLAAALLLGGLAPASAAALTTPGYTGTKRVPPTRPAAGGTAGTAAQPPVPIGGGYYHDMLVDAAGTAHLAWVDWAAPYGLNYCRLKRGAQACEAPKHWNPDGAPFRVRPHLVAYGDQLVILAERGEVEGGPVLAYVSPDGGSSFLDPEAVGGPVKRPDGRCEGVGLNDAVVYGPPGAERIGLGFAEGCVQSVRPGAAPSELVPLAGSDGGAVTLAASDGGLSAAFSDAQGTAVRTWNRTGDVNDPAQWSTAHVPNGYGGRIGGGPGGAYLVTNTSEGGVPQPALRRVDAAGNLGSPVDLADVGIGAISKPHVDASGTVRVTLQTFYQKSANDYGAIILRTLSRGGRLEPAQTLIPGGPNTATTNRLLPNLVDVGGTPDGGGFIAVTNIRSNDAQGPKTITALGFGNGGPTNVPGLGNLNGGSVSGAPAAGVKETCRRIEFGAVDIAGQGGCLLGAVGDPGTKVAEGTLRLNGLEIVPERGVKIMLNARRRTIDTSGRVTVQLRVDDVVVPLYTGELHIELPSGDPDTTTAAPGCTGTKLLGFEAGESTPALKGFPIRGTIAVYLKEDSACIPVSLQLPKVLGSVRGNAVLEADNARGLHLDSMEVTAPNLPIGPVLLSDMKVSYRGGAEDTWTGGATLTFPPGFVLGATVTFKQGGFNGASVTVSPAPYPGTPLFSGVFLNRVSGGFTADPLSLTVGARIGALPTKPPDGYAITVDGRATATFEDPFTLQVRGDGAIFGLGVATLDVTLNSDLYFAAAATVRFDLSILSLSGTMKAYVDAPRGVFAAEIAAELGVLGYDVAQGGAILSSLGVGACGKVKLLVAELELGGGYRWGDDLPDIMWGSCSLDAYRPASRRRQAGGPQGFAVAAGTPLVSVRLTGDGGAPDVVLVSPSGRRIVPVRAGAPDVAGAQALLGVAQDQHQAYVAIPSPEAGTWTVEAQAGSPSVARVEQAVPLPEVRVDARVGGRGRARRLAYALGDLRGRRVTFLEVVPGRGERALGVTAADHGVLPFAPGAGPAGVRRIDAVVEQSGTPRRRLTVARYVAPPPARPAAVTRVVARRGRGTVVARWLGGRGAATYLVAVEVSDGRRLVYDTTRHSLRIPGIPPGARVLVRVAGRARSGRLGRSASARVAPRAVRRPVRRGGRSPARRPGPRA